MVGRERRYGWLLRKLEGDVAFGFHPFHAKLVPILAVVVLVDPRTYLPVIQRTVSLLPGHRRQVQSESELLGYRRLPSGTASEALLKLSAQHPRARVVTENSTAENPTTPASTLTLHPRARSVITKPRRSRPALRAAPWRIESAARSATAIVGGVGVVPFDELTGARDLRGQSSAGSDVDDATVGILGPRGAGDAMPRAGPPIHSRPYSFATPSWGGGDRACAVTGPAACGGSTVGACANGRVVHARP